MLWKNVYVFISSTFNDMHAERDYLVKYVFPELREWCAQRQLNLYDVDLRWGITEEDASENKKTVDICLKNVDDAKPIFLCFLGQRRGWCPTENDVSKETFQDFPALYTELGRRSITELEIMHACIKSFCGEKELKKPFFFIRNPSYLNEIKSTKIKQKLFVDENRLNRKAQLTLIQELKHRFPQDRLFEYTATWNCQHFSPEVSIKDDEGNEDVSYKAGRLENFLVGKLPLKDVVIHSLQNEIGKLYPEHKTHTFDSSEDINQQVLEMNLNEYIVREQDNDFLDNYVFNKSNSKPCYIVSPHGAGKTAFISKCIERYLNSNDLIVLFRFLGVDQSIQNERDLFDSLLFELQNKRIIDSSCLPPDQETRFYSFYNILESIDSRIVIIIDGVDQLHLDSQRLIACLPFSTYKTRFVLSFSSSSTQDALREKIHKSSTIKSIRPFASYEEKASLANAYFSKYLKALDETLLKKICALKGSSNPLFLKIMFSEMRMCGSFEKMQNDTFAQYGSTALDAFGAVLDRLESDAFDSHYKNALMIMLCILACSRNGLTRDVFVDSLVAFLDKMKTDQTKSQEFASNIIMTYYRELQDYLVFYNGVYSIRYESLKKAILKKYEKWINLSHFCIAISLAKKCPDEKDTYIDTSGLLSLRELPYHLMKMSEQKTLSQLLTNFSFVCSKVKFLGIYSLIDDYSFVNSDTVCSNVKQCLIRISDQYDRADWNMKDHHFYMGFATSFWGHLDNKSKTVESLIPNFSFWRPGVNFFDGNCVWRRNVLNSFLINSEAGIINDSVLHVSVWNSMVNVLSIFGKELVLSRIELQTGKTIKNGVVYRFDTVKYDVGGAINSQYTVIDYGMLERTTENGCYKEKEFFFKSKYSRIVNYTLMINACVAATSSKIYILKNREPCDDNELIILDMDGRIIKQIGISLLKSCINIFVDKDEYFFTEHQDCIIQYDLGFKMKTTIQKDQWKHNNVSLADGYVSWIGSALPSPILYNSGLQCLNDNWHLIGYKGAIKAYQIVNAETQDDEESQTKLISIAIVGGDLYWIDAETTFQIPEKQAYNYYRTIHPNGETSIRVESWFKNNPSEIGVNAGKIDITSRNGVELTQYRVLDVAVHYHNLFFYKESINRIICFQFTDNYLFHKLKICFPKSIMIQDIRIASHFLIIFTDESICYLDIWDYFYKPIICFDEINISECYLHTIQDCCSYIDITLIVDSDKSVLYQKKDCLRMIVEKNGKLEQISVEITPQNNLKAGLAIENRFILFSDEKVYVLLLRENHFEFQRRYNWNCNDSVILAKNSSNGVVLLIDNKTSDTCDLKRMIVAQDGTIEGFKNIAKLDKDIKDFFVCNKAIVTLFYDNSLSALIFE